MGGEGDYQYTYRQSVGASVSYIIYAADGVKSE